MSGRSAIVRKAKKDTKDGPPHLQAISEQEETPLSSSSSHHHSSFAPPLSTSAQFSTRFSDPLGLYEVPSAPSLPLAPSSSNGEPREEKKLPPGYARVQTLYVPQLTVSRIEKSSFREKIEVKSSNFRVTLAKTFSSKKKDADQDTITPGDVYELYGDTHDNTNHKHGGRSHAAQSSRPASPLMLRWPGGGERTQLWNKLSGDIEVSDTKGNTLIYISEAYKNDEVPFIRIHSSLIERTNSGTLLEMLENGRLDNYAESYDDTVSPVDSEVTASTRSRAAGPPSSTFSGKRFAGGSISYELLISAPFEEYDDPETAAYRYHMTTRNFFAVLTGKALVGFNFFTTLTDLHERLQLWMPSDYDVTGTINKYIVTKALDDVQLNPELALGLLRWAEHKVVRWEAGWTEAFIHCAGMYRSLESSPDFKFLSGATRALLDRACRTIEERVATAQKYLERFDFTDMWNSVPNQSSSSSAKGSFERASKFFVNWYKDLFNTWPPVSGHDGIWLTRAVAKTLQEDFAALYELLADRDVSWQESETRSSRKWTMVKLGDRSFEADTPDLNMIDTLVLFDKDLAFLHIPAPYPLLPPTTAGTSPSKKGGLWKVGDKTAKHSDDPIVARRAAAVFAEASNIFILGSDYVHNAFVDAFQRFEKEEMKLNPDAASARRGRWVLIYFVMQILASVSVDNPHVKYSAKTRYHLSASLQGTPSWTVGKSAEEFSLHELSHCWGAREKWGMKELSPFSPKNSNHMFQRGVAQPKQVMGSGVVVEQDSSPDQSTVGPWNKQDHESPFALEDVSRALGAEADVASSEFDDSSESVVVPDDSRSDVRRADFGGRAAQSSRRGNAHPAGPLEVDIHAADRFRSFGPGARQIREQPILRHQASRSNLGGSLERSQQAQIDAHFEEHGLSPPNHADLERAHNFGLAMDRFQEHLGTDDAVGHLGNIEEEHLPSSVDQSRRVVRKVPSSRNNAQAAGNSKGLSYAEEIAFNRAQPLLSQHVGQMAASDISHNRSNAIGGGALKPTLPLRPRPSQNFDRGHFAANGGMLASPSEPPTGPLPDIPLRSAHRGVPAGTSTSAVTHNRLGTTAPPSTSANLRGHARDFDDEGVRGFPYN